MSVQISPKIIYSVRARVNVVVVVEVEMNGSWVRGGGRGGARSRQNRYSTGEDKRGEDRTRQR